jgi:predicted dehydrogenase
VIGLGFIGRIHLRAYQQIEACQIQAVCDHARRPVDGVLPAVTGNLPDSGKIFLDNEVAVCRTLEEVLGLAEVDLVDLCVPTPLHHPMAIAALRAGKHVLCEKPLARTAALAREIVQSAQASARFFMPAMCLRFWPEWVWLKKAVDQNTYGKVLAARFRRVTEWPAWSRDSYLRGDQSGGALLDLHVHDADFVQFLFGRPSRVFASGLSRFSGAIDHLVALYTMAGDIVVSAEASWLMTPGHGFSMAYTVNFERATVDYDSARSANALRLYEEGCSPRAIRCDGPDGYVQELRYFVECILAGRPPSVVTARDALSAVEICEAAEESIRTGQPIHL